MWPVFFEVTIMFIDVLYEVHIIMFIRNVFNGIYLNYGCFVIEYIYGLFTIFIS